MKPRRNVRGRIAGLRLAAKFKGRQSRPVRRSEGRLGAWKGRDHRTRRGSGSTGPRSPKGCGSGKRSGLLAVEHHFARFVGPFLSCRVKGRAG